MDPVKLIGDIIAAVTVLVVIGVTIWFIITELIPIFG